MVYPCDEILHTTVKKNEETTLYELIRNNFKDILLSKTSWVQKNTSSGVCPILGEGEVRPHTYTSHLDTGLLPDFAKRNIGRITQK